MCTHLLAVGIFGVADVGDRVRLFLPCCSSSSRNSAEWCRDEESALGTAGALGVLGLGLVYGLKHATEVDHIVAVSTIVSEHRKLSHAAWVGGLWGAGHTISLAVVGKSRVGDAGRYPGACLPAFLSSSLH